MTEQMPEEHVGDEPYVAAAIYQAPPSSLTSYIIWDHELEALASVSRPWSLAAFTTALGLCGGLAPAALDAWAAISTKRPITQGAAIGLIICVVGAVIVLISVWPALSSLWGASSAVTEIRRRAKRQIGAVGQE